MTFRTSFSTVIGFMVVAFLLGCLVTCNCGKQKTITHTVVKSDTVKQVIHDTLVKEKPVPVRVVVPSMAKVDSFIQFEQADTAAILANCKTVVEDYLSEKTYKEKYQFDDGLIEVESTLKNNELYHQKVMPTFYKTTITNSITVENKRRNEVYLGADGYYSLNKIGAGASLMFLHKRGWAIDAGAAVNQYGGIEYRAGFKRKISFK